MKYDGNSEASHTAKAVRLAPKGWRNSCRDTNRTLRRNVDEFHATMRAGLTPRCGRDSRRDAGGTHAAMRAGLTPRCGRDSRRDAGGTRAAMRAGLAPRCGRDSRRDAGSTHPTPTTINRETKTRGHRTPKGYICLMICTTVHENSQAPICRMGGIGHILYPGNRKGRPYRWVGTFQVSNHLSTYYPRTWGPEGVQPCLAGGERSEPPDRQGTNIPRPRRGRIA